MTKNRLEAFSDGVFAIVITLLVIEIRPPEVHGGETLARGLWEQWPNYLGYLLSFVILGVMWLNHHRIFEPVRRVDGLLLVLNLNLLLWAALIPFSDRGRCRVPPRRRRGREDRGRPLWGRRPRDRA